MARGKAPASEDEQSAHWLSAPLYAMTAPTKANFAFGRAYRLWPPSAGIHGLWARIIAIFRSSA
jgi:hypothetical protein